MKIGSNNSLTYLRPFSWWSKVFSKFNRYQTVSYKEQYMLYGVRLFDLRLYADSHCHIIAKNGNNKYDVFSLYDILSYFNSKGDVTLNITFDASYDDKRNDKDYNRIEKKFIEICRIMEEIYPKIKYFGGNRKYDGKKLYEFKDEKENGTPNIIDGSGVTLIHRFFPSPLRHKNKKYIKKYGSEDCYLLLSFVDLV